METVTSTARVLLATTKGLTRITDWATLVLTGHGAIALWEQHRHGTVFADFATLADGMSGVRLAREIRDRCKSTRIYVLSDRPRPDQLQWARSQGADAVIERTQKAIVEHLPAGARPPSDTGFPSGFPAHENPEHVAAVVARRLNEAGLGPAATLAVDDAMEQLLAQHGGLPPSVVELARAVAADIPNAVARARFLAGFGAR